MSNQSTTEEMYTISFTASKASALKIVAFAMEGTQPIATLTRCEPFAPRHVASMTTHLPPQRKQKRGQRLVRVDGKGLPEHLLGFFQSRPGAGVTYSQIETFLKSLGYTSGASTAVWNMEKKFPKSNVKKIAPGVFQYNSQGQTRLAAASRKK